MNPTQPTLKDAPDLKPAELAARGGAIEKIARILDSSGLNAPSELFDEALTLAREGLLGAAADRLRLLLSLDPDDGEAHLLLAKVHVAQRRWQDALAQMDAAEAAQVRVDPSLRREAEEGLRAENEAREARQRRVATREQAELRSLRDEARQLRSENTRLFREVSALKRRVRNWSLASAGLAGLSIVLVASHLLPASSPESPATVAARTPATPVEEALAADGSPAPQAPRPEAAAGEEPAPGESANASPGTAEAAPGPAPTPRSASTRTYVVQKGDTLYELARRFYGDPEQWRQLQQANAALLGGGTSLRPGMELVVPR